MEMVSGPIHSCSHALEGAFGLEMLSFGKGVGAINSGMASNSFSGYGLSGGYYNFSDNAKLLFPTSNRQLFV